MLTWSPNKRENALLIFKSLEAARKVVEEKGSNNVDRVKAEAMNVLTSGRFLRVNYVEVGQPRDHARRPRWWPAVPYLRLRSGLIRFVD